MRISILASLALLVAGAAPLTAQDSASCPPLDSAGLRQWHLVWDNMSDSLLQEIALGRAPDPTGMHSTSGIITVPDGWAEIQRDRVYGRWQLVAYEAVKAGGERHLQGSLRLGPPSRSTKRQNHQTDYLRHDRMVEGWLVGRDLVRLLDGATSDSIRVVGAFGREGVLELGTGFYVMDGGGFEISRVGNGSLGGGWFGSGAVIPPYFGWFCGYRLPTASDSVAWRHPLASAIVDFLRSDSTTAPSEIVAQEPASPWTQALILEVHRQLVADLGGRSADPQRSLELRDPVPSTLQERPDRRVLLEVPFHDARCTAPPGGGQGGYFGALLVARVIETGNVLKADVQYEGNFDGICSTQPHRR